MQTGIGAVAVARPKVRDRGATQEGERIRSNSAMLPRWARRTRSLNALLPTLYPRGVSTGEFQEAVSAARQKCFEPVALSPRATHDRVQAKYEGWQGRDLSARRYV